MAQNKAKEEETEIDDEEIIDDEVEDDDDDEELDDDEVTEDDEEETEEETEQKEEIPEEAQEMLRPSMKKKTQKRIVDLVKKNKELARIVEDLQRKEASRSEKEDKSFRDTKYDEILKKQQKAFDEGDAKLLAESNMELLSFAQKNNPAPVDPNFDIEGYFKEKNSWYGVDEKKTAVAQLKHQNILKDPIWKQKPIEEQLDEVSRRTNASFKKNPYRKSSPSDGAPIGRSSKSSVKITKSDLAVMKKMYPTLSSQELIKKTKKFNANSQKRMKELAL